MIKFEHSIFALPFALTGALLALREAHFYIPELGRRIAWIVVAMVGARSAAMAFNRILDADIDVRNRRTAGRHLPAGLAVPKLRLGFYHYFGARFSLGRSCIGAPLFRPAPLVLATLFFDSFSKRFTSFSHIILGFCLGIHLLARGSPCVALWIHASCG